MNDTVMVTLKASGKDRCAVRAVIDEWAEKYPEGELISTNTFYNFEITLKMPPFTTVQVPQLVDMKGGETEDAADSR